MGNTFKWLALKAGTLLGRKVPSLFYQLIYREIYQQLLDITQDPKMTVDLSYKLGYVSAEESAQRQTPVFRMFPSDPIKVLEYIPLMWQIYFGSPMQEYTTEWDRTDPDRPILNYKIKIDPMSFDVGQDAQRDNLPFKKLWYKENGYGAMMAGLLTQCSSFVLSLKGKDVRIVLKNTKITLRGDDLFEFRCQILPSEEFPDFELIEGFDSEHYFAQFQDQKSDFESRADDLWAKITNVVDIDQLDEMLEDSAGLFRVALKSMVTKYAKMDLFDLMDHFTHDEDKFLQVLGFVGILVLNEKGQYLDKLFETDQVRRVYGHIFRFVKQNATKFVPVSVIRDFQEFFGEVLVGIAPESFISRFKEFSVEDILLNINLGAERALTDLGIPFSELKTNIYEEISLYAKTEDDLSSSIPLDQVLAKREKLYGELNHHIMLISMTVLSIPAQIIIMLLYKAIAGSTELLTGLFKTIRESGQKIVDILDALKE
ncbi:MAG: hypothetical protein ACTSVZ_04990 [Promethearchaeota archaeon]